MCQRPILLARPKSVKASGSSDTEVEDTTDEEHESNGDGGSKTEEEPATVPNIDSPISENDKYELMFFAEGFQDGSKQNILFGDCQMKT